MGKQNSEFDLGAEDDFDAAPNLITVDKDDETSDDFGSDPEEAGDPNAKQDDIPAPVKDAVMKALREAIERLMTIAHAMRGAETAEAKSDRPLPAVFGRELRAVTSLLDGVTTTFPSPLSKAGEGDCPPGFMWDADQGKCVREQKDDAEKAKLDPAVKSAAERMLTAVIDDLTAVRKTVQESDAGNSNLPEYLGQKIKSAAVALGSVLSRCPAATAKGFGLIDLEVEETALLKACETLTLHPEQAKDLCEKVEKCIDNIAVLIGEVDATRARTMKDDDTMPMPTEVAAPLEEIKTDILDVAENYVAADAAGDEGGDDKGAGSDEGGDDAGAEGGSDEPTQKGCTNCGNPDHDPAKKGEGEDKGEGKAEHTGDCPPGHHMVDGKCVPKEMDKDKKSESAPAGGDLAKMIGEAVKSAVQPLNDKLDEVIVKQHEHDKKIKKMADETPESNVTPSGSSEPVRKRETPNAWKDQIGRDPAEIAELEKEDLLF